MACRNIKKILSRYQDNELDTGQKMQVENHLKNCSDCREALSQMNRLMADIKALEPTPSPASFTQKTMSEIYALDQKRHSFPSFRYLSLVYSIIFIFFLSFGFVLIDIKNPEPEKTLSGKSDIYIASLLASEQELGLLDIHDQIMNLVESEVKNEK